MGEKLVEEEKDEKQGICHIRDSELKRPSSQKATMGAAGSLANLLQDAGEK
jgi:hypothetical protein